MSTISLTINMKFTTYYNLLVTIFSLCFYFSPWKIKPMCVRTEGRKLNKKKEKKDRPKYPNHQTRFMSKIKSFFVFASFLLHAYCFWARLSPHSAPAHILTRVEYDLYVLDGRTMVTLNCRNDVVAAGSLCITLIFRDSSSIIMASHLFLVFFFRFDRVFASDLFAFGILLTKWCEKNYQVPHAPHSTAWYVWHELWLFIGLRTLEKVAIVFFFHILDCLSVSLLTRLQVAHKNVVLLLFSSTHTSIQPRGGSYTMAEIESTFFWLTLLLGLISSTRRVDILICM